MAGSRLRKNTRDLVVDSKCEPKLVFETLPCASAPSGCLSHLDLQSFSFQ